PCSSAPTRLPPPPSTLSPYTTLFRSGGIALVGALVCTEKHRHRHPHQLRDAPALALAGRAELPAHQLAVEALRLAGRARHQVDRSEEHTSELQSRFDLVCRLLLEKKN